MGFDAQTEDQIESPVSGADLKRVNTLANAFKCAGWGVKTAARERNFKIDMVAAVLALIACAVLHVELWGWIAVLLCIGLVLQAECANTAIEALVDLASPDVHPLAKIAKDCAAGSALISAIISVIVGLVVYIDALLKLLGM